MPRGIRNAVQFCTSTYSREGRHAYSIHMRAHASTTAVEKVTCVTRAECQTSLFLARLLRYLSGIQLQILANLPFVVERHTGLPLGTSLSSFALSRQPPVPSTKSLIPSFLPTAMGCGPSREDGGGAPPRDSPAWDGHINPVRAWKVEPALTSAQLARLRSEFWETRVEGRPEMWQALRFAAEAESVSNSETHLSLFLQYFLASFLTHRNHFVPSIATMSFSGPCQIDRAS